MKRAHLVIAQLHHENRELKKIALENTPNIGEIDPLIKKIPLVTKSKGKENVVTESVQELEASLARITVTRSSTRNLQLQKEESIQ